MHQICKLSNTGRLTDDSVAKVLVERDLVRMLSVQRDAARAWIAVTPLVQSVEQAPGESPSGVGTANSNHTKVVVGRFNNKLSADVPVGSVP